ncbi:hypothetical protein NADFUDRAFT_84536 [Nadsonia fulvescens var. elongata DSM 6958]|uniref:Uncharacterized protein n=1 Tax=Nadsonia fulvescens var. elongata DSM 6958 TaxID=857566 RepID=A0A1E3PDG9_9ASCO|nr:hypothetical protein NADFUDRAFT_84536 [Nadsonia fulvescens var. elongata DSM 6958]
MSFNPMNAVQLEEPLLRVPFETSRRTFKNAQKIMDHDFEVVSSTIGQKSKLSNANNGEEGKTRVLQEMDSLIERVQGLKRKMDVLAIEQRSNINTIGVRIGHLNEIFCGSSASKLVETNAEKSDISSKTITEGEYKDSKEVIGLSEEKNIDDEDGDNFEFGDDDLDYEDYMNTSMHLKRKKEDHEQSAKYDTFSHIRMTRLLIDHLLKTAKPLTAKALVESSNLAALVDTDILVKAHNVIAALMPPENHQPPNINALLTWCMTDAKQFLKKNRSSLEFETRLQAYIELVRQGKINEAVAYYSKWLVKWSDDGIEYYTKLKECAGLLAYSDAIVHQSRMNQGDMDIDQPEGESKDKEHLLVDIPYLELLSLERYTRLITSFLHEFYRMYGLFDTASNDDYMTSNSSPDDLTPCFQLGDSAFIKCLSTGISVLKTRSCILDNSKNEEVVYHDSMDEDDDSDFTETIESVNDEFTSHIISVPKPKSRQKRKQKLEASSLSASLLSSTFCPVCSTDLASIAKSLPFAHHVHSYVDSDSVVLPNGHIYGRGLLLKFATLMRKQAEQNAKQNRQELGMDFLGQEQELDTQKYVWDLITEEKYPESNMRVVYPS